jgi:hypothetical protein
MTNKSDIANSTTIIKNLTMNRRRTSTQHSGRGRLCRSEWNVVVVIVEFVVETKLLAVVIGGVGRVMMLLLLQGGGRRRELARARVQSPLTKQTTHFI